MHTNTVIYIHETCHRGRETKRRGIEAYRYNKNTFIAIVYLCTNTVVSAKLVIVVRTDRRVKEAYRYDRNTFISRRV